MLEGRRILIAEDETFIAYDIALAIEEAGGLVIGPVASVAEALELLEQNEVSGAILDVNLADRDVSPVANLLIKRRVPMVFHTGVGIPAELNAKNLGLVVCIKPTSPAHLVQQLRRQIFPGYLNITTGKPPA